MPNDDHASGGAGASTIPVLVLWRWLASLKLAVALLVILAVVLGCATLLEASKGREYVQWYVYGSPWFIALLGLLAVNILSSALVRLPWKRKHVGFLLTHAGVLVLLAGAMQTFLGGINGQISLMEGESADSILLPDRSRLTVLGHGQSGQLSTAFSFSPGPVDWGADDPLDFGSADGVRLKVLEFYHHARREVTWVPDDSGLGTPVLKLALAGPQGRPSEEVWCEANPFGGRMLEGELQCRFQQAPVDSMRHDFLEPPDDALGEKGLLRVHYDGQTYRIAVDDNVGKRVPVGDSGFSVKIVAYHANAVSDGQGRFTSLGPEPKNPMLELAVYRPGDEKPISEIAYAMNPFVTYALMRKKASPLKFWYHHPAVSAPAGVEFLQTPDKRLYCRVGVDGRYRARGEVKADASVEVSKDASVLIRSYLPQAREKVTFHAVDPEQGKRDGLEAAALVELTVGGQTHEVWLGRNDPSSGRQTIRTAQGPLLVTFTQERYPLGFSVKLLDFQRGRNPGRMGDASFTSEVQVTDEARGIELPRAIAMNRPLTYGKFTFYQSSFQELPGRGEMSVLSVAHDPGRFLKYLGSGMMCVGIFFVFYFPSIFRTRAPIPRPHFKGTEREARKSRADQTEKARSIPCAT